MAWVVLACVVAFCATVSVYIGNAAQNTLLAKQREFASLLAENLNHQIYRRFTLPTLLRFGNIALRQPAQYQLLDQLVKSTIHGLHVSHLRIFGHSQAITYSTDNDELGDTTLASEAVNQAIVGNDPIFSIENSIPYWRAFFMYTLPQNSFIMRTTYPLRIENRLTSSSDETGPVMGVLEFTQDITADIESTLRFQQLIVAVTLTSAIIMFTLLLFFIRRAERAIALRMQEEQRLQQELHQNEKLAGMGRVVSSIAHEIRNPLGIISSSAELLIKRSDNADKVTKSILQAVYDEAKRLSQTVRDFLDYARPQQPKLDTADIKTLINQAVTFLTPEYSERNINVTFNAPEQPLLVVGDNDLLYRAFYNLLINGIQAVGNTGTVTVTASYNSSPSAIITLVFQDSGPGFPDSNLEKLFDPFFTTKDDGTGLGLPIVNNILMNHGGTLELSNAPEGGARITVTLPATTGSAA